MSATRKDTKPGHRGLAVCFGVVGLVVTGALSSVVVREFIVWRTDVRLAASGVRVEGEITEKRIERRSQGANQPRTYVNVHWLHYAYTTGTGKRVEGRRRVPAGVYESQRIGDVVGVRIDSARPELNVPEFVQADREWEIGYLGVLGWVLILLYVTGRVDSQRLLGLFTADLSGRRGVPTGKSPEPEDEIREVEQMVRAGNRIAAIKLLRRRHHMGLQEAQEFIDELWG
jgi:hypothetical protein